MMVGNNKKGMTMEPMMSMVKSKGKNPMMKEPNMAGCKGGGSPKGPKGPKKPKGK